MEIKVYHTIWSCCVTYPVMLWYSKNMSILVTGGAGYIGSHIVQALLNTGIPNLHPVVVDDLSSGHSEFVPPDVPFLETSVLDRTALRAFMRQQGVTGVVHLAGYKYAGESVQNPRHTYEQNLVGTLAVLDAMCAGGVQVLVNSSSAAVYGTPLGSAPVTETYPTTPESPYGESKLASEWLVNATVKSRAQHRPSMRATSLRYFNVAGSGYTDLYDDSPHNLFPRIIRAMLSQRDPLIFGEDYPTPDKTCIRDYIHPSDVASAHVAALLALMNGQDLPPAMNLSTGEGYSVWQIMEEFNALSRIRPEIRPRREGDPAEIVGDASLARLYLGWEPKYDLRGMVVSAFASARVKDSFQKLDVAP